MDTIFMNSKNTKTYDPHLLILNLSNKIDLKRSDECVTSSNLSIYYTWKNIKKINLKYRLLRGMKNLNYLMDQILYRVFGFFSSTLSKLITHW